MSATFPDGVAGQGTMSVYISDADVTTAVGLAATVDVTQYFRASDFQVGHSQTRNDDTRLGDVTARESFGRSTYTLENVRVIYDPQAAAGAADNKAYEEFEPNTTKFLHVRYGLPPATAPTTGHKLDVFQARFGNRNKEVPGSDENSLHTFTISVSLTRVAEDRALT